MQPELFVAFQEVAREDATIHVTPAIGDVGVDFVVGMARKVLAAAPELLDPALADGDVAHVSIQHGHRERRLTDERAPLVEGAVQA